MNRAVWVVALNAIMQADTSREGRILLPRAFDAVPAPIYLRQVRSILPGGAKPDTSISRSARLTRA